MPLLRTLRYDGPWLQLMPDSSDDCEVLEQFAAAGGGRGTVKEEERLRKLVDERPQQPQPIRQGPRATK